MKSEELKATRLHALNTRRSYGHSWRVFERWCNESGRAALPASPETCTLFLVWALYEREPRYKPANLDHILHAVKDKHRAAGLDPKAAVDLSVREALLAAKRDLAAKGLQRPCQKRAITVPQLQKCVAGFDLERLAHVRNQAILLTTFACGWRRSEMVALELDDVEFNDEGMIVRQHHSKTDQLGRGRRVRIPYAKIHVELCAVRALARWVKSRGNWAGPLFTPLTRGDWSSVVRKPCGDRIVNALVKEALERAGIDSEEYGAHSLRAGMITAAVDAGADIVSIQQRTGQKRIETVLRYVRPAVAMRADPLANVI